MPLLMKLNALPWNNFHSYSDTYKCKWGSVLSCPWAKDWSYGAIASPAVTSRCVLCDLSEVNDGCVACNSKIITSWRIWLYLAYILHAAAPMTCQAVVGKNRWSQRLKLRMRAVKGLRVAARLRWSGRYIVWVHDPLQGQMFHLTGPLSGGQFCQLSLFLPHMQTFFGRVLKAGGKSTEWLCTTNPLATVVQNK